ncbi:ABC transporter permease [Amycolatopsis anabasis]|uniref:ABC transporter permease n=1 Tax=Amycolatopsis anabasis TaxID=1840409 RepID=UPI00131E5ED6|nr:ABC transporter permease [Amycolatopsis anabasis]
MRHWLSSYGLLLRWNALRRRHELPLTLLLQAGLAIGLMVGLSFLVPRIDDATALFLATGAPVQGLITIGMVIAPQHVATTKLQGVFDFNRALPVPRTAMLAADTTVAMAIALPGVVASIFVGWFQFDLHFRLSPLVLPAFLLVALTAVGIGYGIGYALRAEVTLLVCQAMLFFALMFSPINFPPDRLPAWLADLHRVLPLTYMAQAVRETLVTPVTGVSGLPFLVLAAWCLAGLGLTYRVMTRRT